MRAINTAVVLVLSVGCAAPPAADRDSNAGLSDWERAYQEEHRTVSEYVFKGPPEASGAELAQAAAALEGRAAAYGFKELFFQLVSTESGSRVRLTCPSGVTPAMKRVLRGIASIAGNSIEVRMPYVESDAERDEGLYQFDKSTAPEGARWYPPHPAGGLLRSPRILKDSPVLRPPELIGPLGESLDAVRFEIDTRHLSTSKGHRPALQWALSVLVVDGLVYNDLLGARFRPRGGQASTDGTLILSLGPDHRTLLVSLKHPMPFSLEPVVAPPDRF